MGDVVSDVALDEGRLVAIALAGGVDDAPPHEAMSALHADERLLAAELAPRRRRTWVGGRIALRRALVSAGAHASAAGMPLLADPRGAPRVPAGFRGSISHKDELAVAVARADDGWTIGVDVEPVRALGAGLLRRILEREEIDELEGSFAGAEDRGRELLRRFAAKEAIYKAIDPYLGRWVGFLEVVLHRSGASYVVEPRLPPTEPRLAIEVRALDAGDVVLAVARARPR